MGVAVSDTFESSIKRLHDMFYGAIEAECMRLSNEYGLHRCWRTTPRYPVAPATCEERIYVDDSLASTIRIVVEGTTIRVTVTREAGFL